MVVFDKEFSELQGATFHAAGIEFREDLDNFHVGLIFPQVTGSDVGMLGSRLWFLPSCLCMGLFEGY